MLINTEQVELGKISESREFFLGGNTLDKNKFVKVSLVQFQCSIVSICSVLVDVPGLVIQITVHIPPFHLLKNPGD